MKKAIAILFLATYLFSTTELSQLLKLPAFVSHFIEHKEENKDLTLWQFLCIHYAHGDVRDADYEKDMKLPFKTHDNCSTLINVSIPPAFLVINNRKLYALEKKNSFIISNETANSSYLSSIWQPPKSC